MIEATSFMFFPTLRRFASASLRDRGRRSAGVRLVGLLAFLLLAISLFQGPATAEAQTGLVPVTGSCDPPCVEVTCIGPPQACDGEEVIIEVTAYNCSQNLDNITLQVIGPDGASSQFDFFGVEPGASVIQEVTVTQRCDGGGAGLVVATATSTNDCGDTSTSSSECLIECGVLPCVDVVCEAPLQACPGEEITIVGSALNCSDGPVDIQLSFSGPGGSIGSQNFFGVAPGETVVSQQVLIQECDPGSAAAYQVEATATNQCGQAFDTSECLVECADPPCVAVTCDVPPAACPGDEILLWGVAVNCSNRPADIQLTIYGPGGPLGSQVFFAVLPGEEVNYQKVVIHECEPGTVTAYRVEAIATNECGQADAISECYVDCGPPPCVSVQCAVPSQACPGEELPFTAIATNCGDRTVDITVTISGPSGMLGTQLFQDIPPGAEVVYEQLVLQECQPGTFAEYTVEAIAEGDCGKGSDIARCEVQCLPTPCVEIVCEAPPSACPGDPIRIAATAINCSEVAEDISVEIVDPDGVVVASQLFPDVLPGETRTLEESLIPECGPGAKITYSVRAVAVSECGAATAIDECLVECGSEPCLDIFCSAPEIAMDGDPVVIEAEVVNCSGDVENIVVRFYNPDGDQICEHLLASVAPGQIVAVSCADIAHCPEPTKLIYRVVAEAVNSCGFVVAAECEVVVSCEPPVPTRIKLFEAGTDENGVRLELEVQDATASLSAVIHRGVTEDLKYALPITPEPISFTGTALEYVDETVEPGTKYWYWIEIREDGRTAAYAGPIVVVTPEPGASVTFVAPAQPNPTSTSAVFRYSIGSDVAGQGEVKVSLAIYDSRGRLVRTLVNGRQSVGEYSTSWDGRSERGGRVPAGVYYYRFQAGAHSEHSSLVITR